MSDPRVFFAAERTLLAWIRSGIALMAMGFVVARFGLFLTLLTASRDIQSGVPHQHHLLSSMLGIVLVLTGALTVLGAQYNHRLYIKTLPTADIPELPIIWLTSFLSLSVSSAGILLSLYLAFA